MDSMGFFEYVLEYFKKEKSDDEKRRFYEKYTLLLPGIISILIAIIFFIWERNIIIEISRTNNLELEVNKNIINNIAIVTMTFGLGSIVLEFYGFVDYMRRRIKDVIIEEDYLGMLSNSGRKELKRKLDRFIFFPNLKEISNDSLYHVIERDITDSLQDYFYKEYILSVNCTYEEECLKKTIFKTVTFGHIDPNKEVKLDYMFDSCFTLFENVNKDVFVLKKCIFEGENVTNKIKLSFEDIKHDSHLDNKIYQKRVIVKSEGLTFKNKAMLELEYETFVPKNDLNFTSRVNKPCQHYCVHFNYNENEADVYWQGFGFMEQGKQSRLLTRKERNGITIRFKDWILPGDGSVFFIVPKKV